MFLPMGAEIPLLSPAQHNVRRTPLKASAWNHVGPAKVRAPQVADHAISDQNMWFGIVQRPAPGVHHTPEATTNASMVSQHTAHLEQTP